MTRKAAETIAVKSGLDEVKAEFLSGVLDVFEKGSGSFLETLPWDANARSRIQRAPDMVRGMLGKEIEGWASRNGHRRSSPWEQAPLPISPGPRTPSSACPGCLASCARW